MIDCAVARLQIFDCNLEKATLPLKDLTTDSVNEPTNQWYDLIDGKIYSVVGQVFKVFDISRKVFLCTMLLGDENTYAHCITPPLLALSRPIEEADTKSSVIEIWDITKARCMHTFLRKYEVKQIHLRKDESGLLELALIGLNSIEILSPNYELEVLENERRTRNEDLISRICNALKAIF